MEPQSPNPTPTPDPAAPSPPAQAAPPTPVSWAILAANLAVFAWVEMHGSSTDTATLVRFGALRRDLVWSGEWWRLLTAEFLHIGLFHLAANMVFGIPWCRQIERVFGSGRFASLYLGSALGASALSLLGPATVSAGASGALFGVIGASLALHRRALGSWRAFLKNRGSQQVLLNLAILAAIGSFVPIDQLAHAGGLATGAAWGWIATRPWPRRRWPWVALTAAVALAVAVAIRPDPRWVDTVRTTEELGAALARRDVPRARAILDAARARGLDSPGLEWEEARVRSLEGDLEGAIATLESLEGKTTGEGRAQVTRALAAVQYALGVRLLGEGAPRDAERGRALIEAACRRGDAGACQAGKSPAPPPAP